MIKPHFLILIICASGMAFTSHAHLVKTSLSIKGGESYVSGDTVIIKWEIMINHNVPHRIYFSPAKGEAWQLIDSVPEPSGNAVSYKWKVPQVASTTARVRIFQSFVQKPGEQTDDYTIVSKDFTITRPITKISAPFKLSTHVYRHRGNHDAGYVALNGRLIDGAYVAALRERHFSVSRIVSLK